MQNEQSGKPVKKGEAALHIWSHAMLGENEREDVFKTGCVINLMSMVRGRDAIYQF